MVESQYISLYRLILGADIERLAPALKRHYDVPPGKEVSVRGPMDVWNRVEWLRQVMPFMPLPGRAIPVYVRSLGVMRPTRLDSGLGASGSPGGQPCFEWFREFRYSSGTLVSYSITRTPPGTQAAPCVMDMINQPPNLGVVQRVMVSDDGRTLKQVSYGPQYAIVGARLVPLPLPLRITVIGIERAVDECTIHTEVTTRHWLLGPMFGYRGTLTVE